MKNGTKIRLKSVYEFSGDSMDDFFSSSKQPDIITPSHVFQAVDENIKLLGCLSHAS